MLTRQYPIPHLALVWACMLAFIALPARAGCQQGSLDDACALFDQGKLPASYAVFASHGAESVDCIINLVRSNRHQGSQGLALRGFLVEIPGNDVDVALIRLLGDPSPRVRGLVAEVLGGRRTREAVPALIERLSDREATGTTLNGSHSEAVAVVVRDEAIRALEKIADQRLKPNEPPEEKAKAWRVWWGAHEDTWFLDRLPN